MLMGIRRQSVQITSKNWIRIWATCYKQGNPEYYDPRNSLFLQKLGRGSIFHQIPFTPREKKGLIAPTLPTLDYTSGLH